MSAPNRPNIAHIYNPQNQTNDELVAGFVVRLKLFNKLFRDIQSAPMAKPEQHYLIQGLRGMGKTTLLRRIAIEVERTPELAQRLIPIVFNEEEYGIQSLTDWWEKTAEYLAEHDPSFLETSRAIQAERDRHDDERRLFDLLTAALRQRSKKLLLLVDNLGDILKKFDGKEEKRLREILLTSPDLRLIGATTVTLERFHDYNHPFYDFFKVLTLSGLSQDEAKDLFLKLGEAYRTEAVQRIVQEQPGRIEAIRRLTGGVIRTMVLLFEILAESDSGSVFKDLQVLLDRVTPLYKHRMDDLPAQQQKIVTELAKAWDAASTKELAAATRLDSKVVSAQLKQLVDSGQVEKVNTGTKNHLYRLEERFFNIWYLMRFGRKADQRVHWLVKFFEAMFGVDTNELQQRIEKHLSAMEKGTIEPEAALYLTETFGFLITDKENQDELYKKTKLYLQSKKSPLQKELSQSDLEIRNILTDCSDVNVFFNLLNKIKHKNVHDLIFMASFQYLMGDITEAEKYFMRSIPVVPIHKDFWSTIFSAAKSIYRGRRKSRADLGLLISISAFYTHQNKISSLVLAKALSKHLALKRINNTIVGTQMISTWIANNDFNQFIDEIMENILNNTFLEQETDLIDKLSIESLTKLFLAKKQYHTVYNYFQNEKWQLKDRFKPLYYATLHYLKDEYPTEYLRMGPELKETVEEIIADVEQMAIDYA
jgi:hypothetical protein